MKTFSLKKKNADDKWQLIDAKGQTLGRLSTKIAIVLMGKDKASYTPHVVSGDKVVVVNAAKIKVTGNNKLTDKMYYHHSGYPGGIKSVSLAEMMQKKPELVLINSVKGMLPKNKLAQKMLANLKVYADEKHPHEPQLKGVK
jgi:large subunit ribosomal protein L13